MPLTISLWAFAGRAASRLPASLCLQVSLALAVIYEQVHLHSARQRAAAERIKQTMVKRLEESPGVTLSKRMSSRSGTPTPTRQRPGMSPTHAVAAGRSSMAGCMRRVQRGCAAIVRWRYFSHGVTVAILCNTIIQIMMHPHMSQPMCRALDVASFVFACLFALEMLITMIGVGARVYLTSAAHVFDGLIVVLNVIEILLTAAAGGARARVRQAAQRLPCCYATPLPCYPAAMLPRCHAATLPRCRCARERPPQPIHHP